MILLLKTTMVLFGNITNFVNAKSKKTCIPIFYVKCYRMHSAVFITMMFTEVAGDLLKMN